MTDAKTFRSSSWSAGSWRSVPWPFGLIEVTDGGITARAWGWSRWVKDQHIDRASIEVIRAVRLFGTTMFEINRHEGPRVQFRLAGADVALMLRSLEEHGYVLDGPLHS